MKVKLKRGPKGLPPGEHKKPLTIFVKEKNLLQATKEVLVIEKKYNK